MVEGCQPPAASPSAVCLHTHLAQFIPPLSLAQLPPPLPKQAPSRDGRPDPGARLGPCVTADRGGRVARA